MRVSQILGHPIWPTMPLAFCAGRQPARKREMAGRSNLTQRDKPSAEPALPPGRPDQASGLFGARDDATMSSVSKGSDVIDSIRRLAKSKFSGLIQLISGADGGRQRLRLSSIEHHGPDARGRHRGLRFRRRNGEPPACFGQAGCGHRTRASTGRGRIDRRAEPR
jgi:hypothetical protein